MQPPPIPFLFSLLVEAEKGSRENPWKPFVHSPIYQPQPHSVTDTRELSAEEPGGTGDTCARARAGGKSATHSHQRLMKAEGPGLWPVGEREATSAEMGNCLSLGSVLYSVYKFYQARTFMMSPYLHAMCFDSAQSPFCSSHCLLPCPTPHG